MKSNTTKKQAAEKVSEAVEKVNEVKDTVTEAVKGTVKKAVAETSAHIPTTKKSSSQSIKEYHFVEFGDKKLSIADISDSIKKTWKKSNGTEIKSLSIYIKPEESKAYYVINEFENGSLDI